MNKKLVLAIIVLVLAGVLYFYLSKGISEEEAVRIAREAIKGRLSVPDSVQGEVFMERSRVVVEFPTNYPEGVLGGDYYAKVTLDRNSGEVIEILGSE